MIEPRAFERGAHHRHVVETAGDGGERGALGDVGDVRRGVALEVVGGLDDVVGPDHPTHPPPGHGVGLGDTVDDDALLGDVGHQRRHRAELVRPVREVLVDLVGDHPHAALDRPLPDRRDLGGCVDRAGRVVGAHEQQDLRALGAGRFELIDGDLEPGLVGGLDHHRRTTRERDGLRVGRPVRGRADHLVARVAQHRERGEHGVLAAVGDEHLAALDAVAAVAQRLGGDRLLQLGKPAGGGVLVVLRVAARRDRGLDDVLGRREVRLTGAEPDHVLAGGLERLRLGVDGEGG